VLHNILFNVVQVRVSLLTVRGSLFPETFGIIAYCAMTALDWRPSGVETEWLWRYSRTCYTAFKHLAAGFRHRKQVSANGWIWHRSLAVDFKRYSTTAL